MSAGRPIRFAVAGVAAVAVALGAYAIGKSNSGNTATTTTNAAQTAPGGSPAQSGRSGRPPLNGQPPPGFGAPATGAAANKAKAAALAKYKGTAERVMKLPNGTYVVHVLTSGGEDHVTVSKDFKVTGVQQGGPGGPPPAGAVPQNGARPPSGY
jgi:hypothetical protein